ncbi:MAG: methionine--tRNA ligase [Candidatus Spyradenecus sp.]
MEKRKIVVTSALPYANGALHLGHLVEYLQTDFWVRYQKMMGHDCVYVCADDTHGTPIMIRARKEGITPEALINRSYRARVKEFGAFEMGFDLYGSTNCDENRALSEGIYLRLKEKSLISRRSVEQLYCEHCGMFLPGRFVKGTCPKCGAKDQYGDGCEVCNATYNANELVEPYCAVCGGKPVMRASEQLFFELEPFRDFLKAWIPAHTDAATAGKLLEWFSEPLRGWNISRDKPYFGFAIPGEQDKFFYVWLDAPVGYMATLERWAKARGETLEAWWQDPKAEVYHFIGKDIVRFHCLFWPALLENAGWRTPTQVFVHGFLQVNGEKMSKSKGTFVSAATYLKHLPAQALRFYYACKLNGTVDDMDLNLQDFVGRVNSDLVGKITNLASRGAQMINKSCGGTLGAMDPESRALLAECRAQLPEVLAAYEKRDFCRAMVLVREWADKANQLFDAKMPWKLVKEDVEATRAVLTGTLNLFRLMAIALKPILPSYAEKVEKLFGEAPYTFADAEKTLESGAIGAYEHLAARIDPKAVEAMVEASKETLKETAKTLAEKDVKKGARQLATKPAEAVFPEPLAETISIEDFAKVDLRVATVLTAEAVEGSDKLLHLTLDVGEGKPRNVFAGIRKSYAPEALIGQQVVMVANLAPRKMRFGVSEGMIVASTDPDGSFRVMQPATPTAPGARLH